MSEYDEWCKEETRRAEMRGEARADERHRGLDARAQPKQTPVDVADKCSDCCCCYSSTETWGQTTPWLRITTTKCSDNPELVIDNAAIRHPECPRVGKRTVWPEVDV